MLSSLCRLLSGMLLFFAGMALLRKGLKRGTGARVEKALRRLAHKPATAVLVGALATCSMQSSSAVTVITVSLVDSGVIDVYQAFCIVMGANLGTCLTAYIVALETRVLAPLALVASLCTYICMRQRFGRDPAVVFLGLGCILGGVELTGSALTWLGSVPWFLHVLVVFGQIPFFGVLAGASFTGVIQSSSATTAILVGLVREGLVNLRSAISLALGSNIGTCVTTLIISLAASSAGRLTAQLHLVFNVVGVIAVLPVFNGFVALVEVLSPIDPGYRLANAHTLFNLVSVLIVFPWFRRFVDVVKGRREWI